MGRYNLKNDRRSNKYEHDDLDITRLSRELIRPKSANYGYRRESNHPDKVGVSLQFMSGVIEGVGDGKVSSMLEDVSKILIYPIVIILAVSFMYILMLTLFIMTANIV